jgi:3',5'-cyclic AMP phosphodiesterase CpdA
VPNDPSLSRHAHPNRIEYSPSFYRAFIDQLGDFAPDLVIHGGDIGCGGPDFHATRKQFQESILMAEELARPVPLPIHYVFGNHEADPVSGSKDFFLATLGKRATSYYSLRRGSWRLIILDTMDAANTNFQGFIGASQLRWLENELAQSERLGEKVLLFSHHPLMPGPEGAGRGASVGNHEQVSEITDSRAHVVAAFSGHWHRNLVWHSSGVVHTVTSALDSYPCMWRRITIGESKVQIQSVQIELSVKMGEVARYRLDEEGQKIQFGSEEDRDLIIALS